MNSLRAFPERQFFLIHVGEKIWSIACQPAFENTNLERPLLDGHKLHDRLPTLGDDNLLPGKCSIDELGQIGLCGVDSELHLLALS